MQSLTVAMPQMLVGFIVLVTHWPEVIIPSCKNEGHEGHEFCVGMIKQARNRKVQ